MAFFGFISNWTNFGSGQHLPYWTQRWLEKIPKAEMWVRYRTQRKHMYNHVFTDLPPAYYDIDYVMEAALVALLRRYVDEEMFYMQYGDDQKETGWEALQDRIGWLKEGIENPVEGREWEAEMTKPNLSAEEEIATIYQWFCIDKPKKLEELSVESRKWFDIRSKRPFFTTSKTDEGTLYEFDDGEVEALKSGRVAMDTLQEEIDSTTNDMLVRLVKVRGAMWT